MRVLLLSIITVVRNDLAGLVKTMDSIDTFFRKCGCEYDFEHVIIDACSTDGTSEYLSEAIDRAAISMKVLSEPDDGIYDAMNKGVDLAGGKYILFMNAGDVLHHSISFSDIICEILQVEADSRSAGLAYSASINFGGRNRILFSRQVSKRNLRLPSVHQSMIYKRKLLQNYPYSTKYRICGDYENFCRIFSAGYNFRPVSPILSVFAAGGISSINPLLLLKESISIKWKYTKYMPHIFLYQTFRLLIATAFFQFIYLFNKRGN